MTAPNNLSASALQDESLAELDRAALDRLRALDPEGKADVVGRVLRAYESSLRKTMHAMAQAFAQNDVPELRHMAHTLKSSSSSVGAMALSNVCAQTENLLRDPCAALPAGLHESLQAQGELALMATRKALAG